MSLTPWLPIVRRIKDGESVDQATVNVPIDQLTQREQHLYEKFQELTGKSVLISFGQPLHPRESYTPDELKIVYFKSDDHGDGLAPAVTGFSSDKSSSMFSPNNSNYVFGLTKTLYLKSKTADIYTEGLCEFPFDMDDSALGLIQKRSDGTVEPFAIGPYYLSGKTPGKITNDPSGIPVYVGYALSKRKFLLHTSVDEFSQFFINYRYHLLDRVAGIPKLDNDTWSISTKNYSNDPSYSIGTGNVDGIAVANVSTNYVGYPATTVRDRIESDTYNITVTSGTTLGTAAFSVASDSEAFTTKTNVMLIAGNILLVDVFNNNAVKLDFTGSTDFVVGTVWTLEVITFAGKLGWIPAGESGVAKPEGAVFFYNIPAPSIISGDIGLDYHEILHAGQPNEIVQYERAEATELAKYLPPIPANFVQLYVNGTLVRYNDAFDTEGWVSVNEYGIWWHTAADGEQPWSANYPQDTTADPVNWRDSIKGTVASTRKRIFISFSKFNPALRTQLVSSINPFKLTTNRADNFIKFYNQQGDIYEPASTGDIFVDVDPKFHSLGYGAVPLNYPVPEPAPTYTTNRALADLRYSKADGEFKAVITPVVAKIQGHGGIKVTEQVSGTGIWDISYLSQGVTGQVDSIEPINARLEFRELTSYIKLPPPSTTPYGLIGKIVIPRGYIINQPLNLAFHVFGDTLVENSSTNRNIAFQFQYSAISAINGLTPTIHNSIDTVKYYPAVNPVEFSLFPSGSAYSAYTSVRISNTYLSVPADFISQDTVVNFKILRVATANSSDSYTGNIGLVATYWEIAAPV